MRPPRRGPTCYQNIQKIKFVSKKYQSRGKRKNIRGVVTIFVIEKGEGGNTKSLETDLKVADPFPRRYMVISEIKTFVQLIFQIFDFPFHYYQIGIECPFKSLLTIRLLSHILVR